jgi:hypothetical protein
MKGEKTVKKIIAFVMILALLCAMLTSCSEAESLLRKADNFLEDEPYTMTFEVGFESDDPKLNKAFSDFDMEIPVTVDGKNISMDMSMRYNGYNANAKIIVYDMVMYCDITAGRQNAKVKADISDSQYDTLMIDSGAQMPLEIDDFADITVSRMNGKEIITCKNVSQRGLRILNEKIEDNVKSLDGEAKVSDVKFVITLNDGKYEYMSFVCLYKINVDDEIYDIKIKMSADFSYEDAKKITKPSDASKYEEMSFDDLM